MLYKDGDVKFALKALADPLGAIDAKCKELPQAADAMRTIVSKIVSELLYLYKDIAYQSEEEVRTIHAVSLGAPNLGRQPIGPTQFSKLFLESSKVLFRKPKSRIILGPKVEGPSLVMIDLRDRLARRGWVDCEVQESENPYR